MTDTQRKQPKPSLLRKRIRRHPSLLEKDVLARLSELEGAMRRICWLTQLHGVPENDKRSDKIKVVYNEARNALLGLDRNLGR